MTAQKSAADAVPRGKLHRVAASGFLIRAIGHSPIAARSLPADSSRQTNLHATITRNYDARVCTHAPVRLRGRTNLFRSAGRAAAIINTG